MISKKEVKNPKSVARLDQVSAGLFLCQKNIRKFAAR
jgi:hypothetical protein